MTLKYFVRGVLTAVLVLAGLGWGGRRSGAAQEAPTVSASVTAEACHNLLGDGNFEAFSSPWFQSSTPETVTIFPNGFYSVVASPVPLATCDSETCDIKEYNGQPLNGPAGANSGFTWAWFGGGITSTETIPGNRLVQTLYQPITITAEPARLQFNLWLSRADLGTSANDWLEIRLGDTQVFSVTAAATPTYSSGYTTVSFDVSSLVSVGQQTTLTISATTPALGSVAVGQPDVPPIASFNLDDVGVCVPFAVYIPLVDR